MEEAQTLERRVHEMKTADLASKAAIIREQMGEEVAAVVISGCPHVDYNGEFTRIPRSDTDETPPLLHYRNRRGKVLFYFEPAGEWVIHDEIVERFGTVKVHRRAAGGLLPTGTSTWSCQLLSMLTSAEDDAPPPTESPPPEDPPDLDRSNARSWCKRGVMARHPDGRVGEVTMDPDRDSEVKLRFEGGRMSGYVSIHALQYVSQGSPSATTDRSTDDRPKVGDCVRLREGWESVGDASGGPLRPGQEGVVAEDDGSGCPFRVRTESGRSWWYKPAAIEKVVARDASPAGATATPAAAAPASGPFRPPEQQTHAPRAVTVAVLSARELEARDTCMLDAYSSQGDMCMLNAYRGASAFQIDTCMLEFYTGVDQSVVVLYGIDCSFSEKVAEIFGYYDVDADDKLNKAEYKHFLQAILYWGNNKDCTDGRYDEYGWPQECKALECDPAEGISRSAFESKLYALHRRSQLASDLEAVRQCQAKVRGEAPANFDEQGELPSGWRTKVDPSLKKRYYYPYRPSSEEPIAAQWVRPEIDNAGGLDQGLRRSSVPPLVCMSGDGSVEIRDSTIHFHGSFPTVGQPEDAFWSGVAFYEARILSTPGRSLGQIGWATHGFEPSSRNGRGVGDDSHSWGFDGARMQKWPSEGSSRWGENWREGDVIGVAADLDSGEVWFGRNGTWDAPMGRAFQGCFSTGARSLFPALTGARGLKLRVNRGTEPWAFGLPAHLQARPAPAGGNRPTSGRQDSGEPESRRGTARVPPECAARRPTAQGPHTCESCGGSFRQCYGAYGTRGRGGLWEQGSSADIGRYPESPNTRWCCEQCEDLAEPAQPASGSASIVDLRRTALAMAPQQDEPPVWQGDPVHEIRFESSGVNYDEGTFLEFCRHLPAAAASLRELTMIHFPMTAAAAPAFADALRQLPNLEWVHINDALEGEDAAQELVNSSTGAAVCW